MKVLMFGWEYPPHVFGGLATANYGISEGLKAQGDIETVLCLPHPFGDMITSSSVWVTLWTPTTISSFGNISMPISIT